MFTREERETKKRRVGAILLAFALHGGALGVVALAGMAVAPKLENPIEISWPVFPPAPHGESLQAGGRVTKQRTRAEAHPITKRDIVAPQVVAPLPESTPTAVAEAEPTAPGMSGGLNDECPSHDCTGDGPGHGPGDKPGTFGDPNSRCEGEGCTGDRPVDVGAIGVTPVAISQTQPVYPAIARASNLTGLVVAEIIVGVDGRVQSARILKSSPPFDAPALAALATWRYQPVEIHGHPVVWRGQVNLRFQFR